MEGDDFDVEDRELRLLASERRVAERLALLAPAVRKFIVNPQPDTSTAADTEALSLHMQEEALLSRHPLKPLGLRLQCEQECFTCAKVLSGRRFEQVGADKAAKESWRATLRLGPRLDEDHQTAFTSALCK